MDLRLWSIHLDVCQDLCSIFVGPFFRLHFGEGFFRPKFLARMLPKIFCPECWPEIRPGVGFFVDPPYDFLRFLCFFVDLPLRFFFEISCVFSWTPPRIFYVFSCFFAESALPRAVGPTTFLLCSLFFCMDPPLLDYLDFFVLFFSSSSSSMSTGESIWSLGFRVSSFYFFLLLGFWSLDFFLDLGCRI